MSLIELAELVEKASGPDAELGRKVLLACGWRKSLRGYFLGPLETWTHPNGKPHFDDDDFRRYDPTASIDAAMSLAGDAWDRIEFGRYEKDRSRFWADLGDAQAEDCASVVLAICAAALRARAQQEQTI